jgi:AcrR family transcriptional regulator
VARADRLDRILDAGARVLAERGWHGTTMRDVARAAGTSVGILYHYLDGREDLLYRVALRALEAAVASAQAAQAVRGAQARLRALVTDHVRRVLARPAEAQVLRGGAGALGRERARRVEELRGRYVDLVRHVSEAALRRGAGAGAEAEARTRMLLAMAECLALEGARRRPPPPPGRIASRVLQVFLHGARRGPNGA